MSTIIGLLFIAFLVFAVYAFITQYKNTTGTIPKRFMASLGLAAAALIALVTAYLNSGGPTTP